MKDLLMMVLFALMLSSFVMCSALNTNESRISEQPCQDANDASADAYEIMVEFDNRGEEEPELQPWEPAFSCTAGGQFANAWAQP